MGCVELVVGMDRGDNYGINRRTCVLGGRGGYEIRFAETEVESREFLRRDLSFAI